MTTSARRAKLNQIRLTLREASDLLHAAERHWDEMSPGLKAQAFDPGTTRHTPPVDPDAEDQTPKPGDPTGNSAVTPDHVRQEITDLETVLRRLTKAASLAKAIVQRSAVDRPANARELQDLALAAKPGCEIIGRIERPDGGTYWEEIHSTTDLAGTLPRPYRLGSWALQFARRNGRVPTEAEARTHCDGRRVMVTA